MSKVEKILERANGLERVLIVQRPDGAFSYQKQWILNEDSSSDAPTERVWGPPGPYCGIYFSEDMAEQEARLRVDWLQNHSIT